MKIECKIILHIKERNAIVEELEKVGITVFKGFEEYPHLYLLYNLLKEKEK